MVCRIRRRHDPDVEQGEGDGSFDKKMAVASIHRDNEKHTIRLTTRHEQKKAIIAVMLTRMFSAQAKKQLLGIADIMSFLSDLKEQFIKSDTRFSLSSE